MTYAPEIFEQVRDPYNLSRVYEGVWFSDGHCAIRTTGPVAVDTIIADDSRAAQVFRELVRKFEKVRLPALERRPWRVNGRPATKGPKCATCGGEGMRRCNLDEEHDCRDCGGRGHFGKDGVAGQIVFDVPANGAEVLIAGRFWPLVDGAAATCVHVGTTPALGLVDGQDELIGIVMPIQMVKPTPPAGRTT